MPSRTTAPPVDAHPTGGGRAPAGTDEAGELVRCCEELAPTLESRAQRTEELRRLPEESLDDLEAIGFFRVLAPTSAGGRGLGLAATAQATRALAHGCMSTAWTGSFFALHAWMLARFDPTLQQELAGGDHLVRAPAALSPTGVATPQDGGYRLTGSWAWATGVMHADQVVVAAVVDQPDTLEARFLVLPVEDVAVQDVWHMSGMRGTGSNTIEVGDRFVPHHRTMDVQPFVDGTPTVGDALHQGSRIDLPLQPVLDLVASASALGGAERAVELFRERMATRVLAFTLGERQVERPAAQIRLATATATVRAARATWEAAIAGVETAHRTGEPLTVEQRADAALAAAHTVKLAREAVSTVCEAAGASAYAESSPLQRIQRDLETLKGHVAFDWDRVAEMAGRVAVGLGTRPGDLV